MRAGSPYDTFFHELYLTGVLTFCYFGLQMYVLFPIKETFCLIFYTKRAESVYFALFLLAESAQTAMWLKGV